MTAVLLGIVGFVVMIVAVVGVHEFGHFATAKLSGIRVDEFAIGFGPRLLERRRGETVYTLRALPLGGYVRMPGMSSLEADDGGARGFRRAPTWRKLAVLVAGVAMNFLFAGFLLGAVEASGQGSRVPAYGGAHAAGLRDGDVITQVGSTPVDAGDPVAVASALQAADTQSHGLPITVRYRPDGGDGDRTAVIHPVLAVEDEDSSQQVPGLPRTAVPLFVVDSIDGAPVHPGDPASLLGAGRPVTVAMHAYTDLAQTPSSRIDVTATLRDVSDGGGELGRVHAAWRIGYTPGVPAKGVGAAILDGFASTPRDVADNVTGIWRVLTTPNSGGIQNFQGPVGIAYDSAAAVQSGWLTYVSLVAFISLSLGIINLLPVLPFDGGRAVIVLGQAVSRRQLAGRLEAVLIALGVAAVGALFVIITLNDIKG